MILISTTTTTVFVEKCLYLFAHCALHLCWAFAFMLGLCIYAGPLHLCWAPERPVQGSDLFRRQRRGKFHVEFDDHVPQHGVFLHPDARDHTPEIGMDNGHIVLVIDGHGLAVQMLQIKRKPAQRLVQSDRLLEQEIQPLTLKRRVVGDFDVDVNVALDVFVHDVTAIVDANRLVFVNARRNRDEHGFTLSPTVVVVFQNPALKVQRYRTSHISLLQGNFDRALNRRRFLVVLRMLLLEKRVPSVVKNADPRHAAHAPHPGGHATPKHHVKKLVDVPEILASHVGRHMRMTRMHVVSHARHAPKRMHARGHPASPPAVERRSLTVVVLLAQFRGLQRFKRRIDLLELGRRILVLVAVRVILQGQLSKRLFDFLIVGLFAHAQYIIKIGHIVLYV